MMMSKKKLILAFCFIAPFFVAKPLNSFPSMGSMTLCWFHGSGKGSGGFYKCGGESCSWVENEDPSGEADRECDGEDPEIF